MPASVFEKLRTAERLLGEVTAELDGDALDVEGAKTLVDLFTRCERFAVAGRGVAAGRVATASTGSSRAPQPGRVARVRHRRQRRRGGPRARHRPASSRSSRRPRRRSGTGELSEAQAAEIAASATRRPRRRSTPARDRPRRRLVPHRARPVPRDRDARVRRRGPGRAGSTTRAAPAPTRAATAISCCTPSCHPMSAPASAR